MYRQRRLRGLALAFLIVVEAMLLVGVSAGPAAAQLFDDRFPFQNPFGNPFQRQRQYRQPQQQEYWNPFAPQQEQRQSAPAADYSKAPAPKKPETPPSTNVLVFGDSLADWLGYGLEQSFAESPEMGVIRKPRTYSGLIRQDVRTDPRGDHPDWPKLIQETLATEKPDYIVMMIGLNDRRPIRDIRPPRPAATKPGQQPGQPAQPGQAAQTPPAPPPAPAEEAKPDPRKPVAGAPDEAPTDQPADSQQAAAPAGSGIHEFRTDRWSELYIRRIDETIAALKSKGVPVFWVGLPPVKGAKSTADFSYLNDLFRSRAERAGIIFVDVWDGFVDEGGRFATSGPDVEGQIRRLRAGDGVHFTQAGARKLAHYVERELQRVMTVRGAPVAMPVPVPADEPAAKPSEPAKGPAGPAGTARPLSGPVITLTAGPAAIEPDDALLGAPKQTQTAALDVVAAKVIQKGEAMPAPAGRADDFAWPRRDLAPVGADPVVAFTTLPLTPMKSEKQQVAEAPSGGGGTPSAGPPKPAAPTGPRVASRAAAPPQQQGGFGWFGQPYQQQRQYQQQRPTFFPFLFGGGR